jgi:type I restriction enzyme S subunit
MELKPGYKQTEVGVIPEDWTAVALEAVTTHIGDGLHGTPVYTRNSDYYFINGNNLSHGKVIITPDTQAVDQKEFDRHRKPLSNRSILMSINGTIGNLGLIQDQSVVLGKSAAYLNVRTDVSKLYVYHVLQSSCVRQQFFDGLTGSTIGNLGLSAIRSTYIPLPLSDSEQTSIAKALGEVDDLLYSLDQLLIKKQSIKQAALQELLTGKRRLPGFEGEWETIRLGDHVKYLKNGTNSRAELRADGRVKYLHYGDIHASSRSCASPHDLPSLPVAKAAGLDRLKDGDLIFADASEDISGVSKSVEIGDCRDSEVVSGLHTIAARFEKCVMADGFKGFLQYVPSFSEHLRRLAAGTKVYATNRAHISSAEVQLPLVPEQRAISGVLMDMDDDIAVLQHRLSKAHSIKQGMMQQLLTGKIRLK